MRALELFDFAGQQLRVVQVDGQPWFVAADVARILGYAAAKDMTRRLDDDDRGGHSVPTPGGDQQMTIISQPGLYAAVLGSQVEGARAFKRWVTHDVLPAIQRTGGYEVPQPREEPALPGTYLAALKELVSTVERAETAELEAETARARAAELEPKARMAETVMSADGDWSVREAAQALSRDHGISTGQRRLFGTLRELKWVDARGIPYQAQIENGRLSTRVRVYDHPHTGEPRLADPQVRITGKGFAALLEHLTKQEFAL